MTDTQPRAFLARELKWQIVRLRMRTSRSGDTAIRWRCLGLHPKLDGGLYSMPFQTRADAIKNLRQTFQGNPVVAYLTDFHENPPDMAALVTHVVGGRRLR